MPDERKSRLAEWVAGQTGARAVQLTPASADASFRRYFRLKSGEDSLIAMDAPPDTEDTGTFVRIDALLRDAGVHAPRILAHDPAPGFVLMEDLGAQSFLDVLDAGNSDRLFENAMDSLIRMQAGINAAGLPSYDQALLRRELNLFPDWYLARHLQLPLTNNQRLELDRIFALLEESALDQPRTFVHRDFMPRNLIISDPNPGVIDFQDAVKGPVTYDIVCLFKDAFVSWPEDRIAAWLKYYWTRARAAGIPVQASRDEFQRALDWMGVQRHLKVIGIFARLCHRDGKDAYVRDIPRFFAYIRGAAARYPDLSALGELLDAWPAAQGVTNG